VPTLDTSGDRWRVIDGLGGMYRVSDTGQVYSLQTKNFIKSFVGHDGYVQYKLSYDSKPVNAKGHRLVMNAFVGKKNLCIDHINGIKTDNRLENLEYVSKRENTIRHHKRKNGYIGTVENGKYKVGVTRNKKKFYIGIYDTPEQAEAAYKEFIAKEGDREFQVNQQVIKRNLSSGGQ
jgi:hypothetical protein